MNANIITAEAVCLLFLSIIVFNVYFERREKGMKAAIYRQLLVTNYIFVILDMLSYVLDGSSCPDWLLFTITLLSFWGIDFLLMVFCYYIHYVMIEKGHRSDWSTRLPISVCILDMIIFLIGSFTGKIFYIQNGRYYEGPFAAYCFTIILFGVIYFLVFLYHSRKVLGMHDTFVYIFYELIPVFALLVNYLNPTCSFSYIGSSLSIGLIHVLLQTNAVTTARTREELLKEISYIDSLTRLQNRRAYNERMDQLKRTDGFGAAFCDLNGLKYINDHYGHVAGDRYICDFVGILQSFFKNEELYRISGDEFVVLFYAPSQEKFDYKVQGFRELIANNDDIACFGVAYGSLDIPITALVNTAEQGMYAAKEQYYQKPGHTRYR